jgi:putative hydrolase of the HAD superfamily
VGREEVKRCHVLILGIATKMNIECVIFDMDDVLCEYRVETRIAHLAAFSGQTPDSIRKSIWDNDFLDRSDRGEFSADDYLAEFGRLMGYPISRAEWVAARKAAMPPFIDMLELVETLKRRTPVALLTNNDPLVTETIGDLFPQIVPLFGARLFVSASFNLAKPDPACFVACCEAIGVSPAKAFFTDDRVENIEGARKAGLAGHVFAGKAGLTAALSRHGIEF